MHDARCPEAPPNILLITTDQQRFDSLGCNGNEDGGYEPDAGIPKFRIEHDLDEHMPTDPRPERRQRWGPGMTPIEASTPSPTRNAPVARPGVH